MTAAKRDYIQLLGVDGEARKLFKDAVSGATWVDKVCDDLVGELVCVQTAGSYTCLDDNLQDILDLLSNDALTTGLTCFRQADGRWQVSASFRDVGSWSIEHAHTISEAIAKLYVKECKLRKAYNMKELGK